MPGKRIEERDERVKIPLDPETALRALLAADDEPAEDQQDEGDRRGDAGSTGTL
jgi:hypothetical protein